MAPDIAALDKPVGVRCPHLTDELLCGVYERRPQVCRDYAADQLCLDIAAATLEERVLRYLERFGLTEEAARNHALGMTSMRAARRLPVVDGQTRSDGNSRSEKSVARRPPGS